MRILSFDIGIKNLAVCEMCVDMSGQAKKYAVKRWCVHDIRDNLKPSICELSETLLEVLSNNYEDWCVELEEPLTVVIENQPVHKNPTMKTIQTVLFTFFMMMKQRVCSVPVTIKLCSASNKLKVKERPADVDDLKASSKYALNKKQSVCICKHYLEHFVQNDEEAKQMLDATKKKDDLADCFLQAVHTAEVV